MKRAIILAGGRGTRLRPYTLAIPKPLVPIGEMPILEYVIRDLINCGFNHVTLSVNHYADLIKAFFGNGDKWGIKIDYILEDKPLSTMGPLTLINDLPENFLVLNSDILTDLDFSELLQKHIESGSVFTISSFKRQEKIDYGVLTVENDVLTEFGEKPVFDFSVSMGVYAVSKDVLNYIPKNEFFGFDHLMHSLLKEKLVVNVIEHKGYWLDIGRPDDYAKATEDIKDLKA
jgi:NDP-sugar pyrophosphorylase family protein